MGHKQSITFFERKYIMSFSTITCELTDHVFIDYSILLVRFGRRCLRPISSRFLFQSDFSDEEPFKLEEISFYLPLDVLSQFRNLLQGRDRWYGRWYCDVLVTLLIGLDLIFKPSPSLSSRVGSALAI